MLRGPVTSTAVDKAGPAVICCLSFSLFLLLPASYILTSYAPEVYAEQSHANRTWTKFTAVFRDDGTALDSLNQFFTLDVIPHYDLYKEEEIDRSFHFDIALRGRDSDEDQWTVLSSARRYRRLFCKFGRKNCFGIAVLHQISIPYAFYRVDFSVPNQRIDFVRSADFRFKYVRTHFSFYELALRYTLIFVTLWRLYSFHSACRAAGSGLFPLFDSSLMAEQRLSYLLLLTTLLNNDPLYLFTVINGGWTSHLLAAVFTMAFIASLLLFMITMADLSALPAGRRPDLSTRYLLPKIVLILGMWSAIAVGYLHTRAKQGADATYDVADNDLALYESLTFIIYICGLILFFWFIYLVMLRTGQLQQEELDEVVAAPSQGSRSFASAGMRGGAHRGEDLAPDVATPFAFGGPDRGSSLRFYFFLTITFVYLLSMAMAWIIAVVGGPERIPIGHLHRNAGELTSTLVLTTMFSAMVASGFRPSSTRTRSYENPHHVEYYGVPGGSDFDD